MMSSPASSPKQDDDLRVDTSEQLPLISNDRVARDGGSRRLEDYNTSVCGIGDAVEGEEKVSSCAAQIGLRLTCFQ